MLECHAVARFATRAPTVGPRADPDPALSCATLISPPYTPRSYFYGAPVDDYGSGSDSNLRANERRRVCRKW